MLEELHVTDLGVIEHLGLTFGPGMTAVTGETGAGKTLVVGAIDLLLGGRADPSFVRPGATEAVVEGRFSEGDTDWVIRRVVPREGRSRAYVNGAMASLAELSELGGRLVDLHGQHAHQSLLAPATQRAALDLFGRIDTEPLRRATAELAAIDRALADLGGDDRARARELDLLRFQLDELDAAHLDDPAEDAALEQEEDRLADALAHQEAAVAAHAALAGERGAGESVAAAVAALRDRAPYRELEARARALLAELTELAHEVRDVGEGIEPDPERLDEIRSRRRLLRDLCRKYGDSLNEVMAEADRLRARHDELTGREGRAGQLEQQRRDLAGTLARLRRQVGDARRRAAPELAVAVGGHLADLALAKARIEIGVSSPAGDDVDGAVQAGTDDDGLAGERVQFLLAANPGSPLQPLAKVASGGELARAMLALRLVLSRVGYTSPPTQIFDEVDAGIGGAAATAVGEALARLAVADRQILVVTHLPQVAAWATTQVTVEKRQGDDTTASVARALGPRDRVVELARMLSGSPDSKSARKHAAELLDRAATARAGW
jgi:DNA repair protein RecN (Recombination protein N)